MSYDIEKVERGAISHIIKLWSSELDKDDGKSLEEIIDQGPYLETEKQMRSQWKKEVWRERLKRWKRWFCPFSLCYKKPVEL